MTTTEEKHYCEGYWLDAPHIGGGSVVHVKAGYYNVMDDPEYDVVMPGKLIRGLVEYARDKGLVPLVITPQSREEDLKVVHRLLDLLENK